LGGNPYPPHFGARYQRYRCSLPGLAGFTLSRREGTDTGHHNCFGAGTQQVCQIRHGAWIMPDSRLDNNMLIFKKNTKIQHHYTGDPALVLPCLRL